MLCRAYKKADGSVLIFYPNVKLRQAGESDQALLDRIITRDAEKLGIRDHPFVDLDSTQLPPRAQRAKWDLDVANKTMRVKA